jgi:hypothetical protein
MSEVPNYCKEQLLSASNILARHSQGARVLNFMNFAYHFQCTDFQEIKLPEGKFSYTSIMGLYPS